MTVVGGLDIEAAVCSEDGKQTQKYIGTEFYIAKVTLSPATSIHDLSRYNLMMVLRPGTMSL